MILLTGFEPFGGDTANPSWAAARSAARLLQCETAKVLAEALERFTPGLVLCAGQAGGRARISLERVAINCDDARIPDNAGNQPVDEPVVPGGPAAYFTSLPVKAALAALSAEQIPAEVSQSAGTYVCNHVFYTVMHALRLRPGTRGGFVHVPYEDTQLPAGSSAPSLPAAQMAAALAVVVRTALATTADLKLPAGATH